MKIVLDPGHGRNYNRGVVSPYYEGNQMFKLAYFLKEELEKYKNVQIYVTRKKVTDDPSLSARGRTAKGYDLFLSLHSNAPASASQTSIKGTEVYDSVAKPNRKLADAIGKAVAKVMGHNYRGTKYRRGKISTDYYTVIHSSIGAGCPSAMLIEHGFHTNPDDCAFLLKESNLRKIAQAEAKVLADFYKLTLKFPPKSDVLYRVQTGAFSQKSNADALMARVKQAGFDTYMVQDAKGLYKVQVGAYSVRANADTMAKQLKAKGFDTYITTESGTSANASKPAAPTLKVGSKVKVIGSKYSTGQNIPGWVKQGIYTIRQIDKNKVLLREIVSWVNIEDIQIME